MALTADEPGCRRALGLSPSQNHEIGRTAALYDAPTLPAITRYTGVLCDALDIGSLRGVANSRARARLAVGSALFGLVRARRSDTCIPPVCDVEAPRTTDPGGALAPVLEPVLADIATNELVVDLRCGSYVALGRLSSAVHVDVVAEHADGHRTVVSHFNKAHKGRLARALVTSRAEPDDAAKVATIVRRAGMRVERDGNELTVVVDA